MATMQQPSDTTTTWMRGIARGLALIWAAWWTIFGLLSGAGEGVRGLLANAPNALPGLAFLVSAAVAWKWEAVGGGLLILEGVIVLVAYPMMTHGRFPLSTITLVLLTMALPPLVAGILFLAHRRRAGG